jgi:hypothetical protein
MNGMLGMANNQPRVLQESDDGMRLGMNHMRPLMKLVRQYAQYYCKYYHPIVSLGNE